MSKDLDAALYIFEVWLREDPEESQVERQKIERAKRIVRRMKRGHVVRRDEVRFVIGTASRVACELYLNRE